MDENERIAKRIDQIVEEDNDDDEMLMQELEELANGKVRGAGKKKGQDEQSDGGNTSYESMMGVTPSQFNDANQRFMEEEKMKQRMRKANQNNEAIAEDMDILSDYSNTNLGLRSKKVKKKKKKR